MPKRKSHYDWLDENFTTFLINLGMSKERADWEMGLISAHGDKCYTYRDSFDKANIPFEQGVAMYLLTYIKPWNKEVRETENGWVNPVDWIIKNKDRFLKFLPKAYEENKMSEYNCPLCGLELDDDISDTGICPWCNYCPKNINRPCRDCKHMKIYLKDDSWGYCRKLDIEIIADLIRPCNNFELVE